MKVDKSRVTSVRGADGQRLSSIGTSYIYTKVPASPTWRRIKVIVTKTGNNFLLSNADLKNLGILSPNFPEYIGQIRRDYIKSSQKEEELSQDEHGFLASTSEGDTTDSEDVTVSQGESCITVECPEELNDLQLIEAEAYAALYAVGGYTYKNIIIEPTAEECNAVSSDRDDSDSDDGFDEADKDSKVDEEELIKTKSRYEQSFIREFRQLFSETLSPSRFLKCPP